MFKLDSTNHIEVSDDFIKLGIIILLLVAIYFFSAQLQMLFSKLLNKVSQKVGIFAADKEYYLQRYIYQHRSSPLTLLYNWVNEQLLALGFKRVGVTVTGYLLFWGFIAVIAGLLIGLILGLGVIFSILFVGVIYFIILITTRVVVSDRMEKREADVMNAIDLIIPEIGNGTKNAIVMYQDNFAPSLQEDFKAFITNIQDRGYSFEDAMYILTDNLGLVFQDFAQKAIYYEAVGEKEMREIFTDITETNRLRRQLRDENKLAFANLTTTFTVSTLLTAGYFVFLMITDDFSRNFFLTETAGKVLLIIMILVVFLVLTYINTIKSKAI